MDTSPRSPEATEVAYLYLLRDPRTNAVRYVGQTVNPMQRRGTHQGFRIASSSAVSCWEMYLRGLGLSAIFDLRAVVAKVDVVEAERDMTLEWAALGADLLNVRNNTTVPKREVVKVELRGIVDDRRNRRAVPFARMECGHERYGCYGPVGRRSSCYQCAGLGVMS